MKRLIAAIFLLAVSISSSLAAGALFRAETEKLSAAVTDVARAAESGSIEELEESTQALQRQWSTSEKLFHALLFREDAVEVGQSIEALRKAENRYGRAEIAILCASTLNLIESLRDSQKISPENVF